MLGDINELESVFDGDMDTFVQHLHRESVHKKFAKELSQIGGITLDRDSFADYFRSSNGKQLWVDKLSYIVTRPIPMERRRRRPNSVYGATVEALYTPRGCVGSWVKKRCTVFFPPTMKRSWEMDWRRSRVLRRHILLRKGIAEMGERLPIPTNAGSHVPKVRHGEHDISHDGFQQEEKRHGQVHGGSQQERQGHHRQTGVLEPVHR